MGVVSQAPGLGAGPEACSARRPPWGRSGASLDQGLSGCVPATARLLLTTRGGHSCSRRPRQPGGRTERGRGPLWGGQRSSPPQGSASLDSVQTVRHGIHLANARFRFPVPDPEPRRQMRRSDPMLYSVLLDAMALVPKQVCTPSGESGPDQRTSRRQPSSK